MLKRSGNEKHCSTCDKYKPAVEFTKSLVKAHCLICFECSEKEREQAATPMLLRDQAG